jgi:hypothetical protein
VLTTSVERSRNAATTCAGGQPKVKLTSAGGSASRLSILAAQSSSSQAGSPAAVRSAAASPSRVATYAATFAGSAVDSWGTKTFTPNGMSHAALTAAISAFIAAAVL